MPFFLMRATSQFSLTDFGDEIRAVCFRAGAYVPRVAGIGSGKGGFYDSILLLTHAAKSTILPGIGDMLTMLEHSSGLENVKKVAWLA
jgi:hypothetical protein